MLVLPCFNFPADSGSLVSDIHVTCYVGHYCCSFLQQLDELHHVDMPPQVHEGCPTTWSE